MKLKKLNLHIYQKDTREAIYKILKYNDSQIGTFGIQVTTRPDQLILTHPHFLDSPLKADVGCRADVQDGSGCTRSVHPPPSDL